MATENIRQRSKDEQTTTHDVTDNNKGRTQQKPKATIARRGLITLILVVAFPATLHLMMLLVARRATHSGPGWILLNGPLMGSLMSLCAWLVWAEGGFHQNPVGLGLFLGYLGLSLVWDRVGLSGSWSGLVVSLGMFGTVAGCCGVFKSVKPIAGDLAKVCLVWAGIAVVLNIKLLFW